MIKVNLTQFANDIKAGKLKESEKLGEQGYNLTHYIYNNIYNNQPETQMWHYVNKDVYIEFVPQDDYFYVENYGNGCPNWVYRVIQDMMKVARREMGLL